MIRGIIKRDNIGGINMYIWYENYKGGTNNLCVVESHGIVTKSTKGKGIAIKNHLRKLMEVSIDA